MLSFECRSRFGRQGVRSRSSRRSHRSRSLIGKELPDEWRRISTDRLRQGRDRHQLKGARETLRALDTRLHARRNAVANLHVLIHNVLKVLVAGLLGSLADAVLLLCTAESSLLIGGRIGLIRANGLLATVNLEKT